MEKEKNLNNNSAPSKAWIIIGLLAVLALIVVIVTVDLPKISGPEKDIEETREIVIDDTIVEDQDYDEFITEEEWDNIYIDMENSCLESGGVWLEDNGCQIAGSVYYNYDWQLVDDMILSCQENNGTWLGDKDCLINGVVYRNHQWDNMEHLQSLISKCNQAGGDWADGYWECENVSEAWCEEVDGWEFNECASSCRHISDPEIVCIAECVPVCYF